MSQNQKAQMISAEHKPTDTAVLHRLIQLENLLGSDYNVAFDKLCSLYSTQILYVGGDEIIKKLLLFVSY